MWYYDMIMMLAWVVVVVMLAGIVIHFILSVRRDKGKGYEDPDDDDGMVW